MATKEIKQKIVLEGEKQYNAAIKEAQRNLRTLKSELKAETAELGKNATEQQKAEAKTKSLKAQIKEQEKIVKTLRDALKEAKEQYGDNADEVAKWEIKLNNARATLGNMKSDLEGVGQGFKQAATDAQMSTVATKSYADSLEKIANVGEAVSGAIENIFTGMVGTVSDAIGAVWEDMMALASKANAWTDIAGFWNTDAATIQKWARAVDSAYDSFDDLQNAVTRINMGDQKKIAAATNVSGENYKDKWQYAMAVMDSLANMDYESRLNAAGEVFGEKRATKVMDLLSDWEKIQQELVRFDVNNGGIGMTEEQINDMSTLAEQVATIKNTWQAFLDSFEAEHFGKLALDLTGNAQRILDDLIKYLDTGSDEDLAQLEKDVTEFFDRIKKALENAAAKLQEAGSKLEESDNGIVRAIGKAMKGLADALEWISKDENIDKVIHSFEVLAAFWLVGKGVSLISTISQLAANIKVIQGFNTVGAAANAAGGASAAAGSLGASIASALTNVVLPVSLAAILCYPILEQLIHGESQEDKELQEQVEKINEVGSEMRKAGIEPTEEQKRDAGRIILETLFTGKSWTAGKYENKSQAEETPVVLHGNPEAVGPTSPHVKIDATSAQQQAAQDFWDLWRGGNYTDEEFDSAYEQMEAAFAENERAFKQLDRWLDIIMEEYSSAEQEKDYDPSLWADLPASWWRNPGTADENGITSADLEGFLGVPSGVEKAAEKGVKKGISGLRVEIDGQTAGRILAPYVSEEIAKSID